MRKITGVIGQTNSLFVILNQIRTKIGVMYGDPTTTPGGKAIPFHSSIRIKLGAGQQIKDGDDVIGIQVSAKTIKNKVAPPFRTANFQIHFGKGIVEHEEVFDLLRKHCTNNTVIEDNIVYAAAGTGGWKTVSMSDANTGEVISEKKFRKTEFNEVMEDKEWKKAIDILLDHALVKVMSSNDHVEIDPESYEDVKSIAEALDFDE